MSLMHIRWGRLYKGTPAELALEDAVAKLGVPYRTQFPGFLYGFRYFCDFVLPTLKLVIEVDDASHRRADKVETDAERTNYLETEQGWRVVRCTNEEALENPYVAVQRCIAAAGGMPERTPKLADCMPQPKKCPAKIKREARSSARRAKRERPRLVRTQSLERN